MKAMKFLVSTDPGLYGPDVTLQDVQEYAGFAQEHLSKKGYDQVEIIFTRNYKGAEGDAQASLREEIWAAFRGGG